MKKLLLTNLLFIVLSQANFSQYPIVQSVINETNLDSLIFFVEELSGEVQTMIGGSPYTIASRHKNQPGNDKAADYIKQKLDSYGLVTYNQSGWSSTGRNVYGVQTGTDFPNQQYIICAHYDDMPSGPIAPGADDNASGTAAVIEAARILSGYSFPFTIIYALWDEEEQGLDGSDYYATQAANQGDSILGVINLDMIAWDSNNDDVVEIHANGLNSSQELKDKMLEVETDYNIGLNIQVPSSPTTASDHASFWYRGYGAVLLIEDFQDFNAYYHTTNDKIQYFNQPYFHKMAKLAIGTLATFALNLGLKIFHTPIASLENTSEIVASARIQTGLDIGVGANAPRLYYRTDTGSGWSQFSEVVGVPVDASGIYSFTIPGQQLGTILQYYLAAQDENSTIVVTLPDGGSGFSPPGSNPPSVFFQFFVAPIIFVDNATNMNNWSSTGGWNTTSQKYNSAPYSFTDSPGGNYPSNSNAVLTYDSNINLTGNYVGAAIEFYSQWAIEDNWDYGQIHLSTNNGSSWTPLEGLYTNPGSPNQPAEPLYDGFMLSWIKESIDISQYIGYDIKLRFQLISDNYIEEDGWYIDDIVVVAYEEIPTNITSIDIIEEYNLQQNYPNPFNPSTKIKYQIPENSFVSLIVFDLLGNEVTTLVDEYMPAGVYKVEFSSHSGKARNLPSGVYFYTLIAGDYMDTKKMLLVK
jgi:hypothetical protein